jgi:hypothetical protein
MRYLVAIIFAIIGAVAAMQFLSGDIALWISQQPRFESSDDAEAVNQLAFMVVNLLGLVLGWAIGWAIAGPLTKAKGSG